VALNLKQICELIKISGEAKVTELKFQDLHVFFAPQGPVAAIQGSHNQELVLTHGNDIESEQVLIEKEGAKVRQDQYDMALLENPAEYERIEYERLMAGDLGDGEKA
jgi:hypothetical protein